MSLRNDRRSRSGYTGEGLMVKYASNGSEKGGHGADGEDEARAM